ncbi:helix-turn-helix domain-containing protein [Rhodobacteraceae bacterium N5(2021)]|uniref:Helix-turn-helix domain-containing protein n=1 Tax=Gymnodinialimonas phycosphaerae TaxID=2841589 RepID=A0A975TS78_9RHOB|nr:helix-turn-helix domain-containing protein [Gymnodinialimonas phycosphaerae]MBY4893678.1 helix-turn-helix domain-containing protein [Gymnodinialimonas phycosphaerae]
MPDTFSMLLFEGFSNLCLANAVEPLRAANALARAQLYDWTFAALSDAPVHSSSGLPVQATPLSSQLSGAYLFVMPSYGFEALAAPATARALRAAAARFDTLVGLDTGAYLLAHAGLLDGRKATCHWDILSQAEEAFPEVIFTEDRFVIDGNRASCGGATTTLELMLEIIEQRHGASLSLEVAALFMYGERAPTLDPNRLIPTHRTVQAAAALMRRHVEEPLTIDIIGMRLGLSRRALELAFQAHTRMSPGQLYRSIRLAHARRRLEETRDCVAEVALRSGYRDATAMARAFKAEFGITPSAARAARLSEGT